MTVEAPGKLVGAGRNADVYDVGNGQVLRRYRDGRAAGLLEDAWRLTVIQRRLADPNLLPSEAARLRKLLPAEPLDSA